ncbi:alkaline phosphatase D family protein [Auraticoccus monumenti]|uniref:Alkaline phosphatase D n=1 Tax=Auraticoccus monumenti TaxID=675864 RepID=A0A1G7BHI4_9ACTN|nr:alkaline phosphatase D family protein [Auraticoccus monumenti]SDE26442.1 alkaline phosphatase D [Auraticoccus monumenti]
MPAPASEPALGRRRFLTTAGVGLAAATLAPAAVARAAVPADPFTLGVASGDADDTSVVLWTRLAPAPMDRTTSFGMGSTEEVTVDLRVATSVDRLADERTCVATVSCTAVKGDGFSVHALVEGLRPRTRYVYQFSVEGHLSPVGETRTLPAPGTSTPVRFAVINCQNLAGGAEELHFNGMSDLVQSHDVDFVVFLGDYIYEFGRAAHVPPTAVDDIAGYRTRYGQYKSRESLREVHRRFPVYAVPDDHEFFNDVRGGTLPARPPRWNAALRAYWENLPLRGRPEPDAAGRLWLELHRRVRWGDSLDLFLTDIRQHLGTTTMLGEEQETALLDFLTTSTARFTAIGTQTPMTSFAGFGSPWREHAATRARITQALLARKQQDPRAFNPLVLAGDIHCAMVSHVQLDVDDVSSTPVATEFVNAPMTSGSANNWDAVRLAGQGGPGFRAAYGFTQGSSWTQYNGLSIHTVTPGSWTTTYRLGNQINRPDGAITLSPSWSLRYGAEVGSVTPRA